MKFWLTRTNSSLIKQKRLEAIEKKNPFNLLDFYKIVSSLYRILVKMLERLNV